MVFTGIVEELGEVVGLERNGDMALLTVRGPVVTADAATGDSIAINGVCLTVTDLGAGEFNADVIGPTLAWAATSCRVMWTAPALSCPASRALTGRSCASRFRPAWPGTWSTRV